MKVLITGGTGFQGSNLSRTLLDLGHEVTILNTPGVKNDNNIDRFSLFYPVGKCKIVWGTITDKETVEKAMEGVDIVIHTAALIHVDDSISNPTKYFHTNVMGTNNVLEAIRKYDIPLIHISTCEVYGFQDETLKEDSPLMPNSPYAASKAAADRMVYSYCVTYGIRACIIRPFNVFGYGQKDGKCGAVIPIWKQKIYNDEDIVIYGDGSQSREFIHISDVIEAYQIIINKMLKTSELNGKVINIGTGVEVTIKELANTLKDLIVSTDGKGTKSKIIHADSRPGEVKKFISNSNYMKSLGWSPKVDLKAGLTDYLNKERWGYNII